MQHYRIEKQHLMTSPVRNSPWPPSRLTLQHFLWKPPDSSSQWLALAIQEHKVRDAINPILSYLRGPLGVLNIKHHKVDLQDTQQCW